MDNRESFLIGQDKKVVKIINVAGGVITKKGENGETMVLLIQRSKRDHFPNFWEFCRGKCDKPKGENLKHCLKREAKEETGLDVIPIKLIDTFEYIADKGTRRSICYNFLCKMKDEKQAVKLSKEHQNFTWITSVGEAELMILPDQKKTLAKVLNSDKEIVNYPDNDFSKNNKIEEYLKWLSRKKT